jgi:AraC-like DNA-binding protein
MAAHASRGSSRVSAPLVFFSIDIAAVVCAILLAVRVLAFGWRLRSAQFIALIALGTACSVVLSHQEYGPWMPPAFRMDVGPLAPALNLARNLAPGLLMLLCHSLFTDRRRFPRWLLVLLVVQLGLEEPGRSLVPTGWRYARLATQTAPALLQTVFVGFALYWTVADWRADLVESRRRARAIMLVVIGTVTIASVLLTRVLIDPDSPVNYLVHVTLTGSYLAILVFALVLIDDRYLAVGRNWRFADERRPAVAQNLQPALARLTAMLEDQQVCQEPGLSLATLADRVGVPVYRLRKLIHEQLGYQNFNAMLHEYRVKAACQQLRDPRLRRTPILTIALSVGYASVNTFNRGFREVMKVTPSVYRAAELGGGAPDAFPETE